MLSRLEKLLTSPSRTEIEIQLDKPEPTYTNLDCVSGRVNLRCESSMDITTINVTLSGSATTRLTSKNCTEFHHLLQRTEQVFPPLDGFKGSTSQYKTLRQGVHTFPFSIRFPQVSECYKEGMDGGEALESCGTIRPRSRRVFHLLRRLPPSMGNGVTAGEIVYSLNASINRDGFMNAPLTTSQKIYFYPVSSFSPPPGGSLTMQRRLIDIGRKDVEIHNSAAYQVDVKLANGGFLFLGQPIPLEVYIIKSRAAQCDVFLNDFQSMIIETTNIRALGNFQTRKHWEIIQTVTNVWQLVSPGDTPVQSRLAIHNGLWTNHRVPYTLTPTFETCNISRSYKLEIRLGFWFDLPKARTRILETEFPVYILSPGPHGRHLSNPDLPGECGEKEVLRYGLNKGPD